MGGESAGAGARGATAGGGTPPPPPPAEPTEPSAAGRGSKDAESPPGGGSSPAGESGEHPEPSASAHEEGNPPMPVAAADGPRPLKVISPQDRPAGVYYSYDENTGMLVTSEVGTGDVAVSAKPETKPKSTFAEEANSGGFRRLGHKFAGAIRRRSRATLEGAEPTSLRLIMEGFSNAFGMVGLACQGLTGGLALICLYLTYVRYVTELPREGFLEQYSAVAKEINKSFQVLISVSLVAAIDKFGRDHAARFFPGGALQQKLDVLLILVYVTALVLNILTVPMDDMLSYSFQRVPGWTKLPFSAAFSKRLNAWHALNFAKCLFCGFGWIIVCFELRPASIEKLREAQLSAKGSTAAST